MDGEVVIKTSLNTKKFDAQIDQLTDELDTLVKEYELAKKVEPFDSPMLKQYLVDIEKTKNKMSDLTKKQLELSKTNTFNTIGSAIKSNIAHMSKWVLAIFSVRGAYSLIRRSLSILTEQNETLANKINFIKSSLANVLAPIVNWLVNQAYKLVYYIGYILKSWFGIDILSKKTSNNLKSGTKSAKELRKTLAGFDEMNVLQDNVAANGGGTGKIEDPFKGLEKVKIPKWVENIAKNKDKILKFLGSIGLIIASWEIGKLVSNLVKLGSLKGTVSGVVKSLGGMTALKGGLVGVAVALGIIASVQLYKIIKEAKDLHDRMKSLVDMVESSSSAWKKNSDELQKNSEQGKLTEEQQKLYGDTLLRNVKNTEAISSGISEQSKLQQILTGTYADNNKILDINNKEIEDNMKKLSDLYNQGKLNDEQTKKYTELLENQIGKLEKTNSQLDKNSSEYQKNKEKISKLKEEFKNISGKEYTAKLKIDADTKPANKSIGNFLKKMGSSLFTSIFPGLGFANTLRKFKFAKGGIINMPGKGVPISQAIGGERGQEGIVPLTDSQQMQLLGEAIGRYVTINANITNTMNGRVISRELQKVNNADDFAFNK